MAEQAEQQAAAADQQQTRAADSNHSGESEQRQQQPAEIQTGQNQTESRESDGQQQQQTRQTNDQQEETPGTGEGDSFSRSYVETLRSESASYRTQNKALRSELWAARVAAAGRLADPADLPMPDAADPTDAEQVTAAIDELLAAKPHYAARKAAGDIGQHSAADDTAGGVSLMGIMSRNS